MADWYLIQSNMQVGPVSESQLASLGLTPETLVWREGMPEWKPAGQVAELAPLFPGYHEPTPPPMSGYSSAQGAPNFAYGQQTQNCGYQPAFRPSKDKVAAGVLAILLGGLGVHYFYLGKVGAGLITILLSLVTCGIWQVVMLVQGIIMLTMDDWQFQQKYVDNPSFMPLF